MICEVINNTSSLFHKNRTAIACLVLFVAIVAVYFPLRNYDFVNFDDDIYVYENHHVKQGLILASLKWAFNLSDDNRAYWHPVTWISHMLDYELFGLKSGMHHLTSLVIHIFNTLLLFLLFRLATGTWWQSLFIAFLFGIHPINVDSVAWISERKNVLSTFFLLLTTLAYVRYCKNPTFISYIVILVPFVFGLLSKPMLVTLPCVFLLLDYWPLCRINSSLSVFSHTGKVCKSLPQNTKITINWLLIEKIPLLTLSFISIFLASISLQSSSSFISTEIVPMGLRVSNALISYVLYAWKMVLPLNLAVLYPFPKAMPPMWQISGALLILLSVTAVCILASKRRPYLIVGWLWYLGTLVPVIGLVQGGLWPAMADRWAYVPLIGLFIMIAWSVPEIIPIVPRRKKWIATSAAITLTILMVLTHKQVQHWENSITLFTHNINVTSNHPIPYYNLGSALQKQGNIDDAIESFLQAIRIKPDYEEAHNRLGNTLREKGEIDRAIEYYLEALRLNPDYEKAHYNLAGALKEQGNINDAIEHYQEAIRLQPDFEEAHNNLGNSLQVQGKIDDAIGHYQEAIRIRPDYEEAHNNLGISLQVQGKIDDAIEHYLEAIRIRPDYEEAHNNLGISLQVQGKIDDAIEQYLEAIRIKPNYDKAHNNLGGALQLQGDIDDAIEHHLEAIRLKPDFADAYNNLAVALYNKGDVNLAIKYLKKTVEIDPNHNMARKNLTKLLLMQKNSQ